MIGKLLGLRSACAAAAILLIIEVCSHAWLTPARGDLFWPSLTLAVAPLLPGLWVARTNLRRGVLICGIVCMFYFAHGVAEFWSAASLPVLGVAEIVLSLLVIGALGWDARAYKRPPREDDRTARGA